MKKQQFKNKLGPLTSEEKQAIGQVLNPVFNTVGKKFALEVYLSFLEGGQTVTEKAIAEAIANKLKTEETITTLKATVSKPTSTEVKNLEGTVSETIKALRHEGFILDRPRVRGKKLSLLLINPEILFHMAYIGMKKGFPKFKEETKRKGIKIASVPPSLQEFLDENRDINDKLKDMWTKNKVGLGGEQEEIFHVQGWGGELTLANVCGWIRAFKNEISGKKILMLTPHLRLIENETFRELLSSALEGSKCACVFFVDPGKKEVFEKFKNELPSHSMTYEIYTVGKFVFPEYLRVILLGDLLGAIFIKRGDHYVGEIYYKSPENIKNLKESLREVEEKSKRESNSAH